MYLDLKMRLSPEYFANEKKSDRFSINCHLLLTSNGIKNLTGINGRLTSENYINLLENEIRE